MSLLPASIKKIRSKTTEKRWRHRFSHYKSMGAFCCHGNQSFDLICPKTLCSLSPTPVMLHIKIDLGWPAGFRDIQVWKCGRRRRRTDDGPLLYYKLTLWAFGSGELKTNNNTCCQYIGCTGGRVTLSLRCWKLTSLRRHKRRHKIRPSGSLFGKPHDVKQWPSDGFFYPHLTPMLDSNNLVAVS